MSLGLTSTTTSGLFARGPRGYAGGMSIGMVPAQFDLPHPQIHPNVMLVIHQALTEAFALLRQQQGSLAGEKEDLVTIPLYNILENDLRYRKQRNEPSPIPGFDDTLIESITRHSGTNDHAATKLKKEPDLFIKLRPPQSGRVLATDYAIFVECKPVDKDHSVWGDYCEKGLVRFVDGEYAWAMQDSLMIGYVRGRRTLSTNLAKALARAVRLQKLGLSSSKGSLTALTSTTSTSAVQPMHYSEHDRVFDWQWNKGPACPIRVYHSWHDCT